MRKFVFKEEMNLSQISRRSGVPYTTVREYLSAKKDIGKCSAGTLRAIASALGMTMDCLYEMLTPEKEEKKEQKYQGIRIPNSFKDAFWDRDFEHLDLDQETDFIIARLITHDGLIGLKYVEDTFSKEDILHAVKTRRDLNPIVANFLQNRYGLQRCDMNYYIAVNDVGQDWRKNALGNIG